VTKILQDENKTKTENKYGLLETDIAPNMVDKY
jgi:hypothetical protein